MACIGRKDETKNEACEMILTHLREKFDAPEGKEGRRWEKSSSKFTLRRLDLVKQ